MTTQRRRARPSSAHPPLSPGPSTGRRGCDCASVPAAPELQRAEAERLAGVLKALADPARLQLLSLVRDSAKGEACVCDLTAAFDFTQPTISHHLRILMQAGFLERTKRGSWA